MGIVVLLVNRLVVDLLVVLLRVVLLLVVVLSAGLFVIADAADAVPPAAEPVKASAGVVTNHVDARLPRSASISGRVISAATGEPLRPIRVYAYRGTRRVAFTFTLTHGRYLIDRLAPGRYAVCAAGEPRVYGGVHTRTGFVGRCVGGARFDGQHVPSRASRIAVAAGENRRGVRIALAAAAAIAGELDVPYESTVHVTARNRTTNETFAYTLVVTPGAPGYRLRGLTPASRGYRVCFRPDDPGHGHGLLRQCRSGLDVTPGRVTKGVDVRLPKGGAIAGVIDDAVSGQPIGARIRVRVLGAPGRVRRSVLTGHRGRFKVRGLPTGSYRVCALARRVEPRVSYAGRCRRGKVQVVARHVSGGIDLVLAKTVKSRASISGTVTYANGGSPLRSAYVFVYDEAEHYVGGAVTDAAGNYDINSVVPDVRGYRVCVDPRDATAAVSAPPTGWAPRCFGDVAWDGADRATGYRVPLGNREARAGIDIAVRAGGAIAGSVRSRVGGAPVAGVRIQVVTPHGERVRFATVGAATGKYVVRGLSPGRYYVCFDARLAPGYASQCWPAAA